MLRHTCASTRYSVSVINLHHDLPCINGQIGIVETPVELLIGHRLIGGVVVGREVVISQGVGRGDTLLGVKNQHSLEKFDGCTDISLMRGSSVGL